MEKQLNLFEENAKDEIEVWHNFPEGRRKKIEMNFVNLLIRLLCQSIEEGCKNEN
jgi:hypothetical protein